MNKIDPIVKKESLYIVAFETILSVLMQAVFLIINRWDYTALLGNILGGAAAVLNFFLMGIGVQKAVAVDEKQAKTTLRLSQTLRMLMLFVVAVLGVVLDCFNIFAVLIPLFFPRIAVALRPKFNTNSDDSSDGQGDD